MAGNFEVKAGKLLDARCFVADKTALKAQDTWVVDGINYLAEGLTVYVKSEKAVYTYIGTTPDGYASDANWKKLTDQKPTVDDKLNTNSTNPVQNKRVAQNMNLLASNRLYNAEDGDVIAIDILQNAEYKTAGNGYTGMLGMKNLFGNTVLSTIVFTLGAHQPYIGTKIPTHICVGTDTGYESLVPATFTPIGTFLAGSPELSALKEEMNIGTLFDNVTSGDGIMHSEIEATFGDEDVKISLAANLGNVEGACAYKVTTRKRGIFIQ